MSWNCFDPGCSTGNSNEKKLVGMVILLLYYGKIEFSIIHSVVLLPLPTIIPIFFLRTLSF
jgi:hypothetical protein